MSTLTLSFAAGTLELRGTLPDGLSLAPHAKWDARSRCFRAPALAYAELVRLLHREGSAYDDQARAYVELERGLSIVREARPFQTEALRAWREA